MEESRESLISNEKESRHHTPPIYLAVTLFVLLTGALCKYGPLLAFIGPLASEETISVSNLSLDGIPLRFHPHFGPNAASISGEYSSVTRRCTFTYSCTQPDFAAFLKRELLPNEVTLEDGTFRAGRQWGPGVVSYEFFPDLNQATVAASAF